MSPYKYVLPVRIVAVNPSTARQITLYEDCKIDTGFNRDTFVAEYRSKEISDIGVRVYPHPLTLADGKEIWGKACRAKVVRIGDQEFSPGIDVLLLMFGNPSEGLVGLRLLNRWIAEFHGPKRTLSLFMV